MKLRRAIGAAALVATVLAVAACSSDEERKAAHIARAERYVANDDLPAALIELRSALKLAPEDAALNLKIAELMMQAGNQTDALFFYSEASRLDPDNERAQLGQAQLLLFQDKKRAHELIDGVLARNPKSVLAHVSASQLALVEVDSSKALAEAERAVELDPEEPQALVQLGLVRRAQVREKLLHRETPDDALFTAAIDAFERAIAQLGDGKSVLLDRALEERSTTYSTWPGHDVQAAQSYRSAAETLLALPVKPSRKTSMLWSAAHYARGHQDAALETWALGQLIEVKPDAYQAWGRLAELDAQAGKTGSETLARLLELRPDDAEAHALYARRLVQEDRLDDAVAHLEKVSGQLAEPKAALLALAEIQIGARNLDAARGVVERLEKDFSGEHDVQVVSARLAASEGRLDEAADKLRAVTGADDQNAGAQHLLAEVEMRRGQAAAAAAAMAKAIQIQGASAPVAWLSDLGRMQVGAGDWPGAAQTYRRVLRRSGGLPPKDVPRLARALYQLGQPEAARQQLDAVLAQPDPPIAAILLFVNREGARAPQRSRELLEGALARYPGSTAVLARLLRMDFAEGRGEDALRRLDEQLKQRPDTAVLWLMRARALVALHRTADALPNAQHAVELNPELDGGMQLLALLLRTEGRTDDAIKALDEGERAGKLTLGERVLLARLVMERGEEERAAALFEKVLQERADQPGVKNDLAYLILKRGGDARRALQLASEARSARPNVPEFADTLGMVLLKLDQPAAAIDQLKSASELAQPGTAVQASAEYHLGLAFKAAGRKDEAASAFERALASAVEFPEADETRRELRAMTAAGDANPPS